MPIPIPVITAGMNLLGSGLNAISTGANNRRDREFQVRMYERQRDDALADWNRMNLYNSPGQQMQRLTQAGLNPNLVYGNGSVANSSTAIRSSSPGSWHPTAPSWGELPMSVTSGYFDAQVKQAQVDNLRAAKDVAEASIPLKSAQTAATLQSTAKNKFQLDLAERLADISVSAAQANLRKTVTSTDIMLQSNERAAAMNSANMQIAAEKILTMRLDRARTREDVERIQQVVKNLRSSNELMQADLALRKQGYYPGDSAWLRQLTLLLNKYDTDIPSLIKKGVDKLWPSKPSQRGQDYMDFFGGGEGR